MSCEIKPLKKYKPPKLPTLQEAGADLLKTLPHRWKKNAAILACVGIAGMTAFTGCDNPTEPPEPAVQVYENFREHLETAELELRAHWGGRGVGPFYMVHFTEHDVLGFIREKLEEAGLQFTADPPSYTIDTPHWHRNVLQRNEIIPVGIDLFDPQKQLAISLIGVGSDYSAEQLEEAFLGQYGITVDIFRNIEKSVLDDWRVNRTHREEIFRKYGDQNMDMWEWFDSVHNHPEFGREAIQAGIDALVQEYIAERKPEARAKIIHHLTTQIQEFIDHLQTEGILHPPRP